ncbi:hypothetical protein JNB91_20020 [Rhizobium wenxiniae]|uniref:curli-like amyloid fiber formation chaperone CsgH n=1 Tax=Rhizobium wenxiniae TaxID=1737357 RepID=UPI001C6E54EB|nr:curli-like amyloid fiber formation chaperone CsgH [Rhizobium wenxiniae]MBW9090098.1 hypothetical protein [Rhizobium wenxiniae]
MSLFKTRVVLLISSMLLGGLPVGGVSAEDRQIYPGTPADERVASCGIIVSGDEIARIEPFVEADGDLAGRLELDVTKRSPSGQSQSRQAANFVNGRLGTTMISMEGPAEVAIVLSVKDRSGKTLCAMRRSIVLGSIPLKI